MKFKRVCSLIIIGFLSFILLSCDQKETSFEEEESIKTIESYVYNLKKDEIRYNSLTLIISEVENAKVLIKNKDNKENLSNIVDDTIKKINQLLLTKEEDDMLKKAISEHEFYKNEAEIKSNGITLTDYLGKYGDSYIVTKSVEAFVPEITPYVFFTTSKKIYTVYTKNPIKLFLINNKVAYSLDENIKMKLLNDSEIISAYKRCRLLLT